LTRRGFAPPAITCPATGRNRRLRFQKLLKDRCWNKELIVITQREVNRLPERQRIVVSLRDMLGFDSDEVCELLSISHASQRVLLHRGRAAVRQVLEHYLGERR
jgi:DNA-directed RNA polymerase specialized sigma24 family protein